MAACPQVDRAASPEQVAEVLRSEVRGIGIQSVSSEYVGIAPGGRQWDRRAAYLFTGKEEEEFWGAGRATSPTGQPG